MKISLALLPITVFGLGALVQALPIPTAPTSSTLASSIYGRTVGSDPQPNQETRKRWADTPIDYHNGKRARTRTTKVVFPPVPPGTPPHPCPYRYEPPGSTGKKCEASNPLPRDSNKGLAKSWDGIQKAIKVEGGADLEDITIPQATRKVGHLAGDNDCLLLDDALNQFEEEKPRKIENLCRESNNIPHQAAHRTALTAEKLKNEVQPEGFKLNPKFRTSNRISRIGR